MSDDKFTLSMNNLDAIDYLVNKVGKHLVTICTRDESMTLTENIECIVKNIGEFYPKCNFGHTTQQRSKDDIDTAAIYIDTDHTRFYIPIEKYPKLIIQYRN